MMAGARFEKQGKDSSSVNGAIHGGFQYFFFLPEAQSDKASHQDEDGIVQELNISTKILPHPSDLGLQMVLCCCQETLCTEAAILLKLCEKKHAQQLKMILTVSSAITSQMTLTISYQSVLSNKIHHGHAFYFTVTRQFKDLTSRYPLADSIQLVLKGFQLRSRRLVLVQFLDPLK